MANRASVDVAAFANRFDDLRSQELPAALGKPVVLSNGLNAHVSGVELSGTVSVTPFWQLHAAYSHLWERFFADPTSRDTTHGTGEANDPAGLFSLRSYLDLGPITVDAFIRAAGRRPFPQVNRYSEANLRFGWRPQRRLELSVLGGDLLHPYHIEFAAGTPRERFKRSVEGRATWQF